MLKLIINPHHLHPSNLGWEEPVSAGIGVVGSLIGGAISNNANKKAQQRQNRWQHQERLETQEYNTSERLSSQDWQNQQRIAQNQYAEDQYNAYSSPQALARQYAEAGLNPRLAMDGGNVGNVTAGAGSSGSAPSGSNAGFGSGATPAYQPMETFSRSFSGIADGLKALAEARKTGLDTSLLQTQFEDFVKSTHFEAKDAEQKYLANKFYTEVLQPKVSRKASADILNALQDYRNGVLSYDKLSAEIDGLKLDNDVKQLIKENWLPEFKAKLRNLDSQSNLYDQQSITQSAMRTFYRSIAHVSDAQAHRIETMLLPELNKVMAEIDNLDESSRLKALDSVNQALRNENYEKWNTEDPVGELNRFVGHIVDGVKSIVPAFKLSPRSIRGFGR